MNCSLATLILIFTTSTYNHPQFEEQATTSAFNTYNQGDTVLVRDFNKYDEVRHSKLEYDTKGMDLPKEISESELIVINEETPKKSSKETELTRYYVSELHTRGEFGLENYLNSVRITMQ